jgi:hypothetical protein
MDVDVFLCHETLIPKLVDTFPNPGRRGSPCRSTKNLGFHWSKYEADKGRFAIEVKVNRAPGRTANDSAFRLPSPSRCSRTGVRRLIQ